MNKAILLSIVFLLAITFESFAQCPGGRYVDDSLFVVKQNLNIQYGGNTRFNGAYQNLYMNVYEPLNDTLSRRPLIILAFGGSFTFGVRTSPDILRLCNEFTRRGYVTATIDYRLGFEGGNDSDTNQFKALMRAVQDMRASIRYFYKDAQTNNTFKVDTHQIFIGGVSAGGFTALNLAYGKEDTLSRVRPPWVDQALIDIGGINNSSGSAGYGEKVKGVINLCGAIGDTVWLMPGDPVLCGVHGTADSLVPCYFDSAKSAVSAEALMFGSGDLITRAQHIGLPHSIYLMKGADHVPFIFNQAYMDTTIRVIRDFLSQHIICNPLFSSIDDKLLSDADVKVYPNPVADMLTISSAFDAPLWVEVADLWGRVLQIEKLLPHQAAAIDASKLGSGLKLIYFKDESGKVRSVKKISVL